MRNGICPSMWRSMRRPRPRLSACRLRILPARIARSRPSRSRNLRATEIVAARAWSRSREFLEWPFFTAAHGELAQRVDAWAAERFGTTLGSAATGAAHAEGRDSVDAECRQLVRDLGRAG